jgi:hypothetical protein
MLGSGPEDIWGTTNKLKPLRGGGGGGLPKISKKCRGPPKIMYNNNKTSAIIHCDINVNGI